MIVFDRLPCAAFMGGLQSSNPVIPSAAKNLAVR